MPPKKAATTSNVRTTAKGPPKPSAGKTSAGRGTPAKKPQPGKSPSKPAAGAKKNAVPAKGKGAIAKEAPKKEEKKWTEQDDAARKIQTQMRGFLARKELQKRKKEKEEYEDLMYKLEQEAFLAHVKMQQDELEKQRKKEEEERRKRREDMKRKKRVLEAAFEGDNEEILSILEEVEQSDDRSGLDKDGIGGIIRRRHKYEIIDCEDPNGNTPLSEASGGGQPDTIRLLIERGAVANSKGHFSRTPLYRAAFAGHLDAVQVLLEYGADPRIYAEDGQTPAQVASTDAVKEVLESWNIEQTDLLLEKLDEIKAKRNAEDRERREFEIEQLEELTKAAEKEYQNRQKQLGKATEEYNKRIEEHDIAMASGFEKTDLTLQAIKDAEFDLESARARAQDAKEKLDKAHLTRRNEAAKDVADELPGLKCHIRELDEVILRDVGNKMEESGKWPLIIDPSQQAATFLRYRDTNYINALSPRTMEKDRIRMALLGALRFGKGVVLDMMGVDMFDQCEMKFDEVQPNLMAQVMNKSIMQEENYRTLIKDGDGEDYVLKKFNAMRVNNFKFYIVTQNLMPSETLLAKTYPIRVTVD